MLDRVEVGVVTRPHGVRGELRVVLHQPGSTALLDAEKVWLDGEPHRVIKARAASDAVLLQVAGIDDRDAAGELRGAPVEVAREALDIEPGEVLLADLTGCEVVTVAGERWGEVARVETGAQDRLVVIGDGGRERQLPLVDEFVVEIDLDAQRIVIDPPDGLP